jgi:ParB family chromosome partitioning protein
MRKKVNKDENESSLKNEEKPVTLNTEAKNPEIEMIKLDNLVPFANNPFKLYEGQRLEDMVESVKANGVRSPIIVRPYTEEGKYEILDGHNRVNTSRLAKREDIPAIVREGLTDEQAELIVSESNLLQRSSADLKPSEKANAIAMYYAAIKKNPGYRTDLLKEIEEPSDAPVGHRKKTRDKVAEKYGLGKTEIVRNVRAAMLITAFKNRLDNGMSMRAAESLSYLREKEQEILDNVLGDRKITMKQAETLKKTSQEKELDKDSIEKILEPEDSSKKIKTLKLGEEFLSAYFTKEQSEKEIQKIIEEALTRYFASHNMPQPSPSLSEGDNPD